MRRRRKRRLSSQEISEGKNVKEKKKQKRKISIQGKKKEAKRKKRISNCAQGRSFLDFTLWAGRDKYLHRYYPYLSQRRWNV